MDAIGVIVIVLLVIGVIVLIKAINTVPQSQKWVIESLGKYDETWGAGLHFKKPFFQSIRKKVSMMELSYDVPPQRVITKDNVQIEADSFMFFNVFDPQKFTYGVSDVSSAMNALCVSTLRDIIGKMELQECLSSRDSINKAMTQALDEATDKWGIKVTRVEIKNFTPPRNIMESMERQMKADREKREQLIRAQADKETAILDAEKNKEVQRLNAEAARDAAEINAEANRIAMVKKAEAEREAALVRAEAGKAVKIKEAEATAESIRIVEMAKAEGLRAINAAAPNEAALRLKAYDAFIQAANGQATKLIVPSDMQNIVGLASSIKECLK